MTTTITQAPVIEAPVALPEETPIPAVSETCSLCDKEWVTECEGCDRHICRQHTLEWEGFCLVKRTLCPDCFDERERVRLRQEQARQTTLREPIT